MAAGVGVATGVALDHAFGLSDKISDGLLDLVGDEESLAAANSFDNGDYIDGIGHMLSGAGHTIGEAAEDAGEWVADTAGDVYDSVSDAASDVVDFFNPFD